MSHCTACGQNWAHQQADDFPAYLAILIAGHLLAPVIIALVNHTDPPVWALMTLIMASALVLMLGMLQPAKGAIIAIQWWLGMHGFEKPPRPGKRPRDGPG